MGAALRSRLRYAELHHHPGHDRSAASRHRVAHRFGALSAAPHMICGPPWPSTTPLRSKPMVSWNVQFRHLPNSKRSDQCAVISQMWTLSAPPKFGCSWVQCLFSPSGQSWNSGLGVRAMVSPTSVDAPGKLGGFENGFAAQVQTTRSDHIQ